MKRYPGFSRLIAFLLALVLVMSSSASVFAAEETTPYLPVVNPDPPDEALDNIQKNDVMPIAYDYNLIPEEMMDSTILRALEYTGYNVQYQKDTQTLYHLSYIGWTLWVNQPEILSGIPYSDNGLGTGLQTKADSSTPTGRAPDISAFMVNGLDCADFVAYYLCNYLPNIEGADVSMLNNKASELGYRQDDMRFWMAACEELAEEGKCDAYFVTPEDSRSNTRLYQDTIAKCRPGDLIRMGTEYQDWVHYAIYAGTYDGEHYLIHVCNDRGPEINLIRYMDSTDSSKCSVPLAFYHFPWNDDTQELGQINVQKTDANGKPLAGAEFTAVHKETGDKYHIGPTNANGYAEVEQIPFGAYTITETKYPTGYGPSDTSSWTVTLDKSTPNATVTVNAVNKLLTGTAKIVKKTTNGGTVAGWHFTVKDASEKLVGNYVTGSNGIITLDLPPGTYTVTETDAASTYWHNDPSPTRTITVKAGQTATVTFTNQWVGRVKIQKVLLNPEAGFLQGWQFAIYLVNANGSESLVTTVTTDQNGSILSDLEPGTYRIEEVLPEDSAWECVSEQSQIVTIQPGKTTTVTFTNRLKDGSLHVHKVDPQGQPLSDVTFILEYSQDGSSWAPVTYNATSNPVLGGCTSEGLTDGKLTTDENGDLSFTGLYPSLYYRLSEVATQDGYQLLTDYAYEGTLTITDGLSVSLRVVNAPIFELPKTGAEDFLWLPYAILLCFAASGAALLSVNKNGA